MARNPRRGLQRLSCDCGAVFYGTWSQVERTRPLCGSCGVLMVPEHPELAQLVCQPDELEAHPWLTVYARECSSILHGQASHVQRGRRVRGVEDLAATRAEQDRREAARARQLAGLRRAPDSIPF